jgi:hypothetical protein
VPSRGRQRTPRTACLSSAPSPAVDPTRHRPSRSDARVGTATICTFAAIRHGRSRAIARRRVAGRRPVVISSPERRASRIVLLQRLPRGPLRRVPRRALTPGAGRARRRVLLVGQAGLARRPTHTAAMIGVVCAIVTALKAVEVGQDHTPVASELAALTGTASDVLLGLQM